MSIEDLSLDDIYNYIENGPGGNVPAPINHYMELLDKVRGMYLRIDKFGSPEAIIKHLMQFEGLKRLKAKQVFEEALEYFYCDSTISKKAWSNIYASKQDKMINFAMLLVKDIADADKVVNMISKVRLTRQLDIEDKEELPEDFGKQPVKLYTVDAEALGLPRANRTELKAFIENLPQLTEKERHRLMQESDIIPFKLLPDEQENPRQSK